MELLKQCPFCGGDPIEIKTTNDPTVRAGFWQIFCTHCGTRTDWNSNKLLVRNRWNARVPSLKKESSEDNAVQGRE